MFNSDYNKARRDETLRELYNVTEDEQCLAVKSLTADMNNPRQFNNSTSSSYNVTGGEMFKETNVSARKSGGTNKRVAHNKTTVPAVQSKKKQKVATNVNDNVYPYENPSNMEAKQVTSDMLQERWTQKSEAYGELTSGVHMLRQMEELLLDIKCFKRTFATETENQFLDSCMTNVIETYKRWTMIASSYEPDSCRVAEGCLNAPASIATPCNHIFCCKLCRVAYITKMINEFGGENICLVCNQACDLKLLR